MDKDRVIPIINRELRLYYNIDRKNTKALKDMDLTLTPFERFRLTVQVATTREFINVLEEILKELNKN